jgi:hypothetical protein
VNRPDDENTNKRYEERHHDGKEEKSQGHGSIYGLIACGLVFLTLRVVFLVLASNHSTIEICIYIYVFLLLFLSMHNQKSLHPLHPKKSI